MSEDKELLELAAKAAGIRLEWDGDPEIWSPIYYDGKTYHAFNPLTDDGDALRLAVKLMMFVDVNDGYSDATVVLDEEIVSQEVSHETYTPEEATRRAIVRAAAEIGRSMR